MRWLVGIWSPWWSTLEQDMIPSFHHQDFPTKKLSELKASRTVSVCIPAKDEQATVGQIVTTIREDLMERIKLVDEIIVVDDGSKDATAEVALQAGASVCLASQVLEGLGYGSVGSGKGQAMWAGAAVARGELVIFCDADVTNFCIHFVTGILGPLLTTETIGLVKGFYDRPLAPGPSGTVLGGGRVTELVAKPVLSLLFPELAGVHQPLAGETALRRAMLERIRFATGYGVEIGLLIDISQHFGLEAISQVDLGVRHHRNRPLAQLAPQATEVLSTALSRAGVTQPESSRDLPPLAEIPAYRGRSNH